MILRPHGGNGRSAPKEKGPCPNSARSCRLVVFLVRSLGVVAVLGLVAAYYRSNYAKDVGADFVHTASAEAADIKYKPKKSEKEKAQSRGADMADPDKSPAQLFSATKRAALLHPDIFGL